MRLTKLELNGFKSFVKRTEIQFDKGITAIIGPNGSGKSNIADAIRWVLGEQNARILRGNRMEDVIFGGTASKRPMSYCEVTLTFDNEDGSLPIDYSEVSVTRRVYRTGDSEYNINKAPCRLKDIHELFRDTGIGREGYSIVGQNKVEEILSNKSGERRKAFEEAAGIMKYRVRKEEAERKLDNTRKNFIRISDILYELEDRLEPLRQQSDTAVEYLRLRDELKALDVNIFLYQYDRMSERIRSTDDAMAQISDETASIEQDSKIVLAECESLEKKEREFSERLSEINALLISNSAQIEADFGEIRVLDERIANAGKDRDKLIERIAANKVRKAEIDELLNVYTGSSAGREEALNALRNDMQSFQEQLISKNSEIADKEFELDRLKDEMVNSANRMGDAKSQISRLTAIKNGMLERLENMSDDEFLRESERLSSELTDADIELKRLEQELKDINDKIAQAAACANETLLASNASKETIRTLEQSLEGKRSRLKVLMEMKRAHEGFYSSIKNLLQDCEHDDALSACVEGVVAEIIRVPVDYETAVEMTLGNALQNVVTPDSTAGKRIIEHLRAKNYGRATLLPVSTMKSRTLNAMEREYISVEGCFGVASELVEFEPRYKNIVENLLGRTVIVRDLDTGIKLARASGQSFRVATLDGDIINPGGSMTGGSLMKKEFSLLGRARECTELLSAVDADKKALIAKRAEAQNLQYEVDKAQSATEMLIQNRHELNLTITKQNDKLDIIKQYIDKNAQTIQQSSLERIRIEDSIRDIDKQLDEAQKEQDKLTLDSDSARITVTAYQQELLELRNVQTALNEKLTDVKVRITALQKEDDALRDEHKRLSHDLSTLIATIDYDTKAISQYELENSQLVDKQTQMQDALAIKRAEALELNNRCSDLEEQRTKLAAQLDAFRNKREELSELLTEKRERLNRLELNRKKSELEMNSMLDKMWNDYELTYENALPYRSHIAITSANQRVDELRRAIRELGDINVNAIDDFKSLSDRYDSLKTQCDDLQRAETDLTELISQLVTTMERDFTDKFEQIRDNFQRVFAELFGGGSAELLLSNPDDILNCDIDILAQIPGKKLQSLAPLSGGERALTAIALQFAILSLKPTAFCLLDEIDASLDEVNVTNFANYIHSYADKTQFILITHRKGSMEACNSLYGVAQEEKGVSKIVSARLNQLAAVN